jgi:hypothetical protein
MTSLHVPSSARAILTAHRDRLAGDPVPPSLSPAQQTAAHTAVQNAFLDGFHWAMGTCIVVLLLAATISALAIRDEATAPIPGV